MIIIKECPCVNEGQDALHGKRKRVHNIDSKGRVVCTVCRRTDGVRGKFAVRKHPSRAREYREGMTYTSC